MEDSASAGGGKMRHAHVHEKRVPQDGQSITRIFGPSGTAAVSATGILSDPGSADSAFTTITQTQVLPITQPASTFTTTAVVQIPITNSAQLSSYLTGTSVLTSTLSPTSTSSGATHTAAAKTSSKSPNLATLIPAIVVPVAVILLASFALFWWWMRKRAREQAKNEPEFVMAGKPEKQLSRNHSNSSRSSSTRELVPMSKLEKETAITTKEVKRSDVDMYPPSYTPGAIGTARPMTPPDRKSDFSRRSDKSSVPNFSSPRPVTSHRRQASNEQEAARNRSKSASTQRPMPGPNGRNSPYHQNRSPPSAGTYGLPRGPAPARPPPPKGFSPDRPPRPRAEDTPSSGRPARSPPGSISTNHRAAPPTPLSPPTPTGAFNGSSPISQYSPIVKDAPNLGAIAAANTTIYRGEDAPTLQTQGFGASTSAGSPVDDSILSKENMRIARLANSSRLGFNTTSPLDKDPSPLATTSSKSLRTNKAASPRLPPPVNRDLEPPARQFGMSMAPSSAYSSPRQDSDAEFNVNFDALSDTRSPDLRNNPSMQPPAPLQLNHANLSSASVQHNRGVSVISRLSSDDGYADMEVPQSPKSDVSSLNEDEKWEMATERVGTSQSNAGIQSLAATGRLNTAVSRHDGGSISDTISPSSATERSPRDDKYRDRDSEGPFVLSRY